MRLLPSFLFLPFPCAHYFTCFFPPIDDKIENFQDLVQAVKGVGNWRGLCLNLDVDQGIIDTLIHSPDVADIKKLECLRAYFDQSKAKWSQIVRAVAMYPVNKKRIAKNIAKGHGIEFDKLVKDEL